jgi:hypothetical protein
MDAVNPGIRLLTCGCLLNTTVLKNGTGRVDISPCKEECPKFLMLLAMAEQQSMQIVHDWEK